MKTDWLKDNAKWIISIVFGAGILLGKFQYDSKDRQTMKTDMIRMEQMINQNKNDQNDYNATTDQKIDDVKAWQQHEDGRQAGYKQAMDELKKK